MEKPTVSVCVITYNHEKFITDTIEGIINQKNVSYEVIIGDDYSTDNTVEICKAYSKKYPFIKIFPSSKNLGVIPNFVRTINLSNGKYIAMCEGDDYWLDPHKLEIQKKYLDEYEDCVLTYHNVLALNVETSKKSRADAKYIVTQKRPQDLQVGHRSHTSSMFFRNNRISIPQEVHDIVNGDSVVHFLLKREGKIQYLDNIYPNIRRRHRNSVYSYISKEKKLKQSVELQKKLLDISINRKERKIVAKNLVKSQSRYLDYLNNRNRSEKNKYLRLFLTHALKNHYLLLFSFYHIFFKNFLSGLLRNNFKR